MTSFVVAIFDKDLLLVSPMYTSKQVKLIVTTITIKHMAIIPGSNTLLAGATLFYHKVYREIS